MSWQPSIAFGRKRTTSTYSEYLLRKCSSVRVASRYQPGKAPSWEISAALPSRLEEAVEVELVVDAEMEGDGRNRRGPQAVADRARRRIGTTLAPPARPVASPHELIGKAAGPPQEARSRLQYLGSRPR